MTLVPGCVALPVRCLAANGEVYAVIDPVTNGFAEMVGYDNQVFSVPLYNARGKDKKLDVNGFELVPPTPSAPFPVDIDFTDENDILTRYYPLMEEFLRQHLGAYKVYAFNHYVRSGSATLKYEMRNGQRIGGPATFMHGDYALLGAPIRRDNFTLPPPDHDSFKPLYGERPLIPETEMAELRHRRFAIVNFWRNLADEPLVDMPLCFCDETTNTADDYVAVEFRYTDRTIETYLAGYAPRQRWYYFPHLVKEEGILLKTFDSQGRFAYEYAQAHPEYEAVFHPQEPVVPATSVLHGAVKDPRVPLDVPPRRSIEVRMMVFY